MTICECSGRPPETGDDLSTSEKAMLDHLETLTRPLTEDFLAGVFQGFTDRVHVDSAHPDRVEDAAALALVNVPEGDALEGWLLGYRFVERSSDDGSAVTRAEL